MKKAIGIGFLVGILLVLVSAFSINTFADEAVIYEQDFELTNGDGSYKTLSYKDLTDKADFAAAITKGTETITCGFNGWATNYPNEFSGENHLNERNNLLIENGRLKVMKMSGYPLANNYFNIRLPEGVTGQVLFSFDLEVESYTGYSTNAINVSGTQGNFTACTMYAGSVLLGWQNTGNYPFGGSSSYFKPGAAHKVEILIDYDNQTYWGYCEGIITAGEKSTGNASDFRQLQIVTNGYEATMDTVFYIDNIKVEKLSTPMIAESNVSNGQTAVSVDPISLRFNVPMNIESLNKIKLYDGETRVENAVYRVSEDGLSLTLDTPLKYSTRYSLKIDNRSVMADSRLYVHEEEIAFHTMHEPHRIKAVSPLSFKNADNDEAITSLAGVQKLAAEVQLTNSATGSRTATLILVLYKEDASVEKIESIRVNLAAGENKRLSVTVDLPEQDGGRSASAFLWEGFHSMRMIVPSAAIEDDIGRKIHA